MSQNTVENPKQVNTARFYNNLSLKKKVLPAPLVKHYQYLVVYLSVFHSPKFELALLDLVCFAAKHIASKLAWLCLAFMVRQKSKLKVDPRAARVGGGVKVDKTASYVDCSTLSLNPTLLY